MKYGVDATRRLHFDCECRPGAWIGGDYVSRSLTAIAWQFADEDKVHSVILSRRDKDTHRLLEAFLPVYNKADVVSGHFIRGFDLPLLAHECQDNQMPLLEEKLSVDTKLDLVRGIGGSKSQENLSAQYELAHPKIGMSVPEWESFNLWLSEAGTAAVLERVIGDVDQHVELYSKLQSLAISVLRSFGNQHQAELQDTSPKLESRSQHVSRCHRSSCHSRV
jgi:hypothetical protein